MQPGPILGKRILLADDQPGVREAVRMLLCVDEHLVTEARDGKEALDLFSPGRFDLVITDYSMPRMAGNELATRIKAIAPEQPIIMITAFSEELNGFGNPVDAILNKPFSFSDLRKAIAELVR